MLNIKLIKLLKKLITLLFTLVFVKKLFNNCSFLIVVNFEVNLSIKLVQLEKIPLIKTRIDRLEIEYKALKAKSNILPLVWISGCVVCGRIKERSLCKPILLSITPNIRLSIELFKKPLKEFPKSHVGSLKFKKLQRLMIIRSHSVLKYDTSVWINEKIVDLPETLELKDGLPRLKDSNTEK